MIEFPSAPDWIIWDWNGTLLDDRALCIDAMNQLLGNRNLPLIDVEKYQSVFGFPVRTYYEKLGFNFENEPFEIPALAFMDIYRKNLKKVQLQANAISVLQRLKKAGYQQAVLSAMEQQLLLALIDRFELSSYFSFVTGIDNHYGGGKVEAGNALLSKLGSKNTNCLLVGDTLHDYEVAKTLGMQCVLFAGGHHSHDRLIQTEVAVINNLDELILMLEKRN